MKYWWFKTVVGIGDGPRGTKSHWVNPWKCFHPLHVGYSFKKNLIYRHHHQTRHIFQGVFLSSFFNCDKCGIKVKRIFVREGLVVKVWWLKTDVGMRDGSRFTKAHWVNASVFVYPKNVIIKISKPHHFKGYIFSGGFQKKLR